MGQFPAPVAVTPNGSFAYVGNRFSNNISVIDTATNTVTTTVPIGDPTGIAITPNGAFAYVTDGTSGVVNVIDLATNTVQEIV